MSPSGSDNVVYILGAGFSRLAGIPLLDDFLFEARRLFTSGRLAKEGSEYRMFDKVFRKIAAFESIDKYVNFNFFNLEEVFGLFDLGALVGDDGEGGDPGNPDLQCFRRMIKTVLREKQKRLGEPPYKTYRNVYRGFLATAQADGANPGTIISFNYDEIIEIVHRWWVETGAPGPGGGKPLPLRDYHTNHDGPLQLLKLHGSIGWERSDGDTYLLPPTWNKVMRDEEMREVFLPIWTAAHGALSQAHTIVLIGYSFPDTDQYFRHFLAHALSENLDLERIVVVNPDASVHERFGRLVGEHFLKYVHLIEATFQQVYAQRGSEARRQYEKAVGFEMII